jgi:predicted metal-dependent hydrolase
MDQRTTEAYDPRYLGGILFFNDRDFFEAHEVWEDLWLNTAGPERKFFQGLIQAAVALYHFGNSNLRGALKLYHSSRDYLKTFEPAYLGLDLLGFAKQMERCFAEALATTEPDRRLQRPDDLIPAITLDPPPEHWPDPAEFATPEN